MKVIIDTNVLMSAVLKDGTPEKVILFLVKYPDFEWIVSPEIIQEYKEVLARDKFNLPEELLKKWVNIIEKLTTTLEVDINLNFPRDQKDAKFLSCALTANAEFFITGDKDFTEPHKLINTKIISVSLFKKIICDAWLI